MFSEATNPQSEHMVSPLMSSASQEFPPQTLQEPEIASVLLDLDGRSPVEIGPFLEPLEVSESRSGLEFVALSIISTCSCIVVLVIFKLLFFMTAK